MYLDHKNLELDTTAYHFYIACEYDKDGYRMFGYFSKEKSFSVTWDNEVDMEKRNVRNLSCIFVLPFYQRKGYGKFLISFSNSLGKLEGRTGGPETPLSDLGNVAFKSLWTWKILNFLKTHKGNYDEVTIRQIGLGTGILEEKV